MSEPFYYGPWDITKLMKNSSGSGLPEYFPPMIYDFHLYGDDGDNWEEIIEVENNGETYPIRYPLMDGAMNGETNIVVPSDYTNIKIEFSNTNAYTIGEDRKIIAINSPIIVENIDEYIFVLCDTDITGLAASEITGYNISQFDFTSASGGGGVTSGDPNL